MPITWLTFLETTYRGSLYGRTWKKIPSLEGECVEMLNPPTRLGYRDDLFVSRGRWEESSGVPSRGAQVRCSVEDLGASPRLGVQIPCVVRALTERGRPLVTPHDVIA